MHGAVLCYITNGRLVTGIYTRTRHGFTLVTHPTTASVIIYKLFLGL